MVNQYPLNNFLLTYGDHRRYRIHTFERRKGYAKEMLRQALNQCQKHQRQKVLITVTSQNTAPAKTILANHRVLENEMKNRDQWIQRYWITLSRP